ncbi:MAG TPA: hypothetical protein VL426_06210 [Candidatus Binatia bacterium]|jgi:hypothetical protein|nr:hypothetical protein [Candidatus Binatia bacterium]
MVKKWLQQGFPVQVRRLGDTGGWRVNRRHLRHRSEGARGEVIGPAFGNRGEVILVEHANGEVGAYHVDELAPA